MKQPESRALEDAEIETIKRGTRFADVLPFTFKESGFRVTAFGANCAKCGKPFEQDDMVCSVANPTEHVLSVTAIGLCTCCNIYTVNKRRVKSDKDGTRVEYYDGEGKWVSIPFQMMKKGVLAWLKKLILRR